MWTWLVAMAVAGACAWALTPFARYLAERFEALDRPDRDRKKHRRLVPLWGGLAIFPALILGVGAALGWTPGGRELWQYRQNELAQRLLWLLPAWFALGTVGLIDDKFRLPPKVKLLVHMLAAASVVWAGFRWSALTGFGGGEDLRVWPYVGALVSIVWITFMTNAFNFVDGLDGLAVGQALIAGVGLALAAGLLAAHQGDLAGRMQVSLAAPLAGAVAGAGLGFWRYNRAPAKIFLGDAGSTLLGFTLAVSALAAAGRGGTPLAPVVPLLCLAWPLADATLAVIRRWRRHEPISKADHRHLHHRLLEQDFTPGAAVAFIRTVSIVLTLLGLAAAWW
ncbi:MAG: undecaprenyl/decaprenyl-phosphate alpha-N-acetylglucosaminyl 1-phosphate transferase [Candidatus Firestonebacteria bacterium]|nr:undecaprenyl/decaprenyl-phosphate alpha-N-acetylglucosaminyl 1-phosphate transferase [Candidatus Firestonebacteria bacterium]